MIRMFVKTEYAESLTDESFAVLTGLLQIADYQNLNGITGYTSPTILASKLFGHYPSQAEINKITKGFAELESTGYLKRINKSDYQIFYSGFIRTTEYYVELSQEEIRTIFNSCNKNPYSLLRYYANLKASFDHKLRIGYQPLDRIIAVSGKSRPTVVSYNELLENLNLLIIYRFKPTKDSHGQIRQAINVYCRPEDRESAESYINHFRSVKDLETKKGDTD